MREQLNLSQTADNHETAFQDEGIALSAADGGSKARHLHCVEGASAEDLIAKIRHLRSEIGSAEREMAEVEARCERLPRSRKRSVAEMEMELERAWGEFASSKEIVGFLDHLARERLNADWLNTSQLHVEDLRQEGFEWLVGHADGFDPSLGYRFTTYARRGVGGAMSEYLSENAHVASIPQYSYNSYKSARQALGPDAAPADFSCISRAAGDAAAVAGHASSLDEPVMDGDLGTRSVAGDFVASRDSIAFDPLDAVICEEVRGEIYDAVNGLDDRHRLVASSLFGLAGSEPETPRQLAKRLGVSEARVSQMKSEARGAVRKALEGRGISMAA